MRHLTAFALTLAVALPVCAQRGAHAGFSARPAPSFGASAGFRSAPSSVPHAQVFPGTRPVQGLTRPAPVYPRTFTPGARPYAYAPGRAPVQSMHQPPHGFSPARPTFYHRDRDGRDRRHFPNQGGPILYTYPVVQGFTFWPYDDISPAEPYTDPTYENLSNDGVAPGSPANEPDAYPENGYPQNGYPAPPPPGYAEEPASPASVPAPPVAAPEMQYVPGSADKVTLIFKDGRPPEEIQNYLATPSTVTVLDGHRRRQISVADLDLPATIKANQQTGVDFRLPTAAK